MTSTTQAESSTAAENRFLQHKKALKLLGEGMSSALASKVILLEKLGRISDFLDDIIKVGAAFSELNTGAKVVFKIAKVVFKKLQSQRECHEAAVNLAGFLLDKLPVTDIIPKKLQNEQIRNTVRKMLKITEEALNVLNNYANGFTFNTELSKIKDLKARLTDVSANFSLSLTAQTNIMAQESKERQEVDMLKKLEPVAAARESRGQLCLEETRTELLGDLTDISEERNKLIWLHGFAGSGKSSIAATVCKSLKRKGVLAGSHFCKRDIPEQREPRPVLPSLSYSLCLICRPYRDYIIRALEEEPDIETGLVDYQLTTLFLKPLAELVQQNQTLRQPIVFVIDALDECGTDDTSRS